MSILLIAWLAACTGDTTPSDARVAAMSVRPPGRRAERRMFHPGPLLETFAPAKVDGGPRPVRGAEAVAIFDVDVDGRADVVLVNGENRIYTFLAAHEGRPGASFVLHETTVGPEDDGHVYDPKGLAVHDWDGDGALDLWVGNQGPGEPVVYHASERLEPDAGRLRSAAYATRHNARDGTFPAVEIGFVGAGGQRALLLDDLDRDGHVDAFRSNSAYYGPYYAGGTAGNALQRGLDGGRFGKDVIATSLDVPGFWTNPAGESEKNFKGVVVRDLDHDGRGDLVLGAFADVWANYKAETITSGKGFQGTWARGVFLLHNVSDPGRLRFHEVAHDAIGPWAWNAADAGPVHAVLALDLDGDADLDLLLTAYKGVNGHGTIANDTPLVRVLRNDSTPGSMRFADVTTRSGLDVFNDDARLPPPYPIDLVHHDRRLQLWPAMLEGATLDVDNDGDADVVLADRQIVRADPRTRKGFGLHAWLLLNDGTGRFEIVDVERHGLKGTSRALSVGDLDADGRVDVVLADGSGGGQVVTDVNRVWWNEVDDGHGWASVEASVPGDPWAIGARVTVRRDDDGRVLGHDEIRTDMCYRSRRDASVHVGTADAARIRLEVVLPDRRVVTCPPVVPGRRFRVDVDASGTARLHVRPAAAPRADDRALGSCTVAASENG